MQQLSAQDAQFLYLETANNYAHVTMVTILDPSSATGERFDFDTVLAHIRGRLHASPVFQRRLLRVPLDLDFPYWVNEEYFDLESHVTYGRLPAPGTWEQFCTHLGRYHSRPLDMNRPLWEMYVIEGLDAIADLPAGCFAIATKMHHAAIDGASAVRFFAVMSDSDADGTPAVDISMRPEYSGDAPEPGQILVRALLNHLSSPVRLGEALLRLAPAVLPTLANRVLGEAGGTSTVPDTRFNAVISPQKVFDAVVFDLDDLKTIRKAVTGAKINDVVLAIISGALRRYLSEHRELPDESLIGWVPINARPREDDADDVSPGNRITAMTTALHTDVAEPLERLRAITASTQDSKAARSGLSARLMTDLSQHIPGSTMALASRLILHTSPLNVTNLFVSNVPGPQVPLYIAGARVVRQFGLAPLANGMGLFIAVPSYDGQISFSVTTTREIVPDLAFFMQCLRDSMDELRSAAAAPKNKPRRKSSRRTTKKKAAR